MIPFHIQLLVHTASGSPASFSAASGCLQAIPRLHLEPDGSFVWRGDDWQLEGMLYDRDECLQSIELKGHCPFPAWRQLIGIFNPPRGGAALVSLPSGGLYDLQTFEGLIWSASAHSDRDP